MSTDETVDTVELHEIVPADRNGDVEVGVQRVPAWEALPSGLPKEAPARDVSLLFDTPPRQRLQCCKRRLSQRSTITSSRRGSVHSMACLYPMYVISVEALLKLETMDPHQVMLERGLLVEWTPAMSGRIIFVSHEWLGWHHADPESKQLVALKRLLERLCKGEVRKVESFWAQRVAFKQNTAVTAKEWKLALPHMFVWMDFLSIPQVGVRGTAEDS